jgi:hypothetical protein
MAEVRQCAWCWLVKDHAGAYTVQASGKINSATHGICPRCKAIMLAEIGQPSLTLLAA